MGLESKRVLRFCFIVLCGPLFSVTAYMLSHRLSSKHLSRDN